VWGIVKLVSKAWSLDLGTSIGVLHLGGEAGDAKGMESLCNVFLVRLVLLEAGSWTPDSVRYCLQLKKGRWRRGPQCVKLV